MSARLSILIYHRVLAQADPLQPGIPDAKSFERHMRGLRRWFRVLPLGEAVDRLYQGRLPRRAVAVTFDDGYRDNAEVALPILSRLGIDATFFIATGFLNGGRMWNDTAIESIRIWPGADLDLPELELEGLPIGGVEQRRAAIGRVLSVLKYLPSDQRLRVADRMAERAGLRRQPLMMDDDQVRQLARAGMGIGGHTITHPILANRSSAEAEREIADGKAQLEGIVGTGVDLFAYPNGGPETDYKAEHVALVRQAGFKAAVSTAWGTASSSDDRYQLPRFTPWDVDTLKYLTRLELMRWRGSPASRVGVAEDRDAA